MPYAQFAASTQFYLYGKKHFTQTGYEKHAKKYDKDFKLDEADLSGKNIMVTGSNSGIGKEIAKYTASRGANLYMVCRNEGRAEKARQEIIEETKCDANKVTIIQADLSLESSVRAGWEAFQEACGETPRLDALVCNAGVLLNERTLTREGIEVTFACHLLFGSYLLGSLALPLLQESKGRLVFLSSGGMYNTKFPSWAKATSLEGKYDGNLAYAYAKRAQVLLAEQWAKTYEADGVKVVTAHPGWTLTDAVDAAYGDQKKYLEPMRTPWQGAEGTAWLLACESKDIESGAFYLDRSPQTKHLAGPFFTEGSYTKNTEEEVAHMMTKLEEWANGKRPTKETLSELHEAKIASVTAEKSPAPSLNRPLDIQRFMGKWYVVAHIPTFVDKGTANNTEDYVWDAEKSRVNIRFSYSNLKLTKTSTVNQTGQMMNDNKTVWQLAVKVAFVPLSFPYVIHDCSEDYTTCIVGEPKRSFLYLMARTPSVPDEVLDSLRAKSLRLGYDTDKLALVPQNWPEEAVASE